MYTAMYRYCSVSPCEGKCIHLYSDTLVRYIGIQHTYTSMKPNETAIHQMYRTSIQLYIFPHVVTEPLEPWSDILRHITTYYDISDMSCHTTYPTCPTCPSGAEVLWVCQGMSYCLPTCPTYPTSLRCPTCPTSHTHNTLTDTPPHPLISRPNLQNMHWHMI